MYLFRRLCARIESLVVKHQSASVGGGFCRSACSELAGLDSSSRLCKLLASGTEYVCRLRLELDASCSTSVRLK
jgi:hypothetical protein